MSAEGPRAEASSLQDPRWDAYVRSHPDATWFHRSGWHRVAARTFGYPFHGFLATRDGRVTGALPLSRVPGFPRGVSLISSPLAVYGGVIADDAESGRALLDAAAALGRRLDAGYLELRGGMRFDELPGKDLYVTFRRPIGPDHDANFAAIRRKQRTSIRNAQKHDLRHRFGRHDLVDTFYSIYSRSLRDLGTPSFPKRLFHDLLDEFEEDCDILVVEREGKPLASVLSFYDRNQVLPYYAGTLREGYPYSASDFMYWSLMSAAADRGCTLFDFGRSKRGTGAFEYKRHWGFEPTPLDYRYQLIGERQVPDLSPKNPRFSLAIQLWRRLPLAVTQRLGPAVVRYFP